ncbi:uncharacterized protein LOC122530213 [Frieseomelitta varia]|uniref:uncharacterized protein LOC122530213 n=1 Tax=Frieseomelitta varia TaxID=561572 RepID=UPI001CB68EAD|nr:uncharacterized protein LOC122530213 [Frieseomelitta varia]
MYILLISEMNTFVCKLIFCAKIVDCESIIQLFDNLIKKNITQHITGLLLVYSDFMIHLIEASEDDVFQLCHEVFTNNSSIITNVKCLYMQNNAKKRFFKEWYFKKMKDNTLKDDKLKELEDNFENVSSTYKAVVVDLFKLYIELWHKLQLRNYENFNEYLDIITVNGYPNIPSRRNIKFILQSVWGYNLTTLIENYYNLNYVSNFDNYSSVSEMIQEIKHKYNE